MIRPALRLAAAQPWDEGLAWNDRIARLEVAAPAQLVLVGATERTGA